MIPCIPVYLAQRASAIHDLHCKAFQTSVPCTLGTCTSFVTTVVARLFHAVVDSLDQFAGLANPGLSFTVHLHINPQ